MTASNPDNLHAASYVPSRPCCLRAQRRAHVRRFRPDSLFFLPPSFPVYFLPSFLPSFLSCFLPSFLLSSFPSFLPRSTSLSFAPPLALLRLSLSPCSSFPTFFFFPRSFFLRVSVAPTRRTREQKTKLDRAFVILVHRFLPRSTS